MKKSTIIALIAGLMIIMIMFTYGDYAGKDMKVRAQNYAMNSGVKVSDYIYEDQKAEANNAKMLLIAEVAILIADIGYAIYLSKQNKGK